MPISTSDCIIELALYSYYADHQARYILTTYTRIPGSCLYAVVVPSPRPFYSYNFAMMFNLNFTSLPILEFRPVPFSTMNSILHAYNIVS